MLPVNFFLSNIPELEFDAALVAGDDVPDDPDSVGGVQVDQSAPPVPGVEDVDGTAETPSFFSLLLLPVIFSKTTTVLLLPSLALALWSKGCRASGSSVEGCGSPCSLVSVAQTDFHNRGSCVRGGAGNIQTRIKYFPFCEPVPGIKYFLRKRGIFDKFQSLPIRKNTIQVTFVR